MNHGAVRKLIRAAALSLFVLMTASGVAGLQVLAASPAMADAADQGKTKADDAPGGQGGGNTPAPAAPDKNPVTNLLGGVLGSAL